MTSCSSPVTLAKAFKLESDFGKSIFRCDVVKILVNPLGLTAFLPCTPKILYLQNSATLKVLNFCVDFGEDKHIRLTPMCANEPKAA